MFLGLTSQISIRKLRTIKCQKNHSNVSAHPSTAISCVALSNTMKKNPSEIWMMFSAGFIIISSIVPPILHNNSPVSICTGTIQDLRLPNDLLNTESTIGDQNNFSEYGYPASENKLSFE
ncbi:hypothetical protein AX774_g3236 [Zancudomyces culisetae]|uniref:Uncharacterized protein n=1 Tax=Zancudomyces culisetae TaxID=1213189 RepID=A0A1R1PQK1_ZANCU|nr:hypothetical protein AX774_g3236 [Zancudomyces culisetae]|eukprot:OMH83266.1 hypothetical protein AX774_g3236 [Zancudomyces culisetae]